MKKMKIFFMAAALALVTAGVFAGSSKFFTNYEIVAYSSTSGYHEVIASVGFPAAGLTLTQSGTQAKLMSSASGTPTLGLFATNATFTEYYPIYTSGF